MDPEPNEEAKVSVPVSSSRSGGAADEPTSPDARGVEGNGGDQANSDAASKPAPAPAPARKRSTRSRPKAGTHPNNVRRLRQRAMMSKAELARRAGVSPLTIDRVESGCPCRMDTKRKILEALGIQPASAAEVFPDVDLG